MGFWYIHYIYSFPKLVLPRKITTINTSPTYTTTFNYPSLSCALSHNINTQLPASTPPPLLLSQWEGCKTAVNQVCCLAGLNWSVDTTQVRFSVQFGWDSVHRLFSDHQLCTQPQCPVQTRDISLQTSDKIKSGWYMFVTNSALNHTSIPCLF